MRRCLGAAADERWAAQVLLCHPRGSSHVHPLAPAGGSKVGFDTMAEKKEAQRMAAEAQGPEALAAWHRKEDALKGR